jgi:hypothetical protein
MKKGTHGFSRHNCNCLAVVDVHYFLPSFHQPASFIDSRPVKLVDSS